MLKVGITGGIGSGKSYICQVIEKLGYPVYDSDNESKKIVESSEQIKQKLVVLLGTDILKNNSINRDFLATKLFNSPEIRSKVNEIIHPIVRAEFVKWAANQDSSIVFNEAAIFFETGAYKNFDKMVLVTAPIELRIQRVMKRNNLSEVQVLDRMKSQWLDKDKRKLSDFEIINDGQPILIQIENIIRQLKK